MEEPALCARLLLPWRMKVYIDESGSFAEVKSPADHRVAVIAGICGTDSALSELYPRWSQFVAGLQPDEFVDGEPKGKALRPPARQRFGDLMSHAKGVLVCPAILDLAHFAGDNEGALRTGLVASLRTPASEPSEADALQALASDVEALSHAQLTRLYGWAVCADRCVRSLIALHPLGPTTNIEIVCDRVSSHEDSVLGRLLAVWLVSWSKTIATVPGSPFAVAMARITEARTVKATLAIRHGDSKLEPGLQIADAAASIVNWAAKASGMAWPALDSYARLMRACPYVPDEGFGLVTPLADAPRRVGNPKWNAMAAEARYASCSRTIDPTNCSMVFGTFDDAFGCQNGLPIFIDGEIIS